MDQFLYIDQGASLSKAFTTGINLTGYEVAAQIRKWYDGAKYHYVDAVVSNVATGQVTLSMTPDETADLEAGRNVFDVVATNSGGNRIRLVQGQAIVTPGLTGVNPPTELTIDDEVLLEILQGSTYSYIIELRDPDGTLKDLTGFTARMQIRPTIESPVIILNLTSATNALQLSGGTVTINLTDTQTADLTFDTAVYDLEIISPSNSVQKVMKGRVYLVPNITK